MFSKMLLIVNPCAGMMRIKPFLLEILKVFSLSGFTVTVYPTKCRGDAESYAFENSSDYDVIVCCGGDGTLNEVINGIMQCSASPKLGYIPCGTLNEWSAGLHISRNIVTAAKDISGGKTIPLDIGKFNNKYFSYTASFGAFTEASYSAPQDVKNVIGQVAYFLEGIKSIGNIKPVHMVFDCDGNHHEGDYIFGAISNSMSVGGIVKFQEAAVALNDGEFEIFLIRNPENPAQFQSLLSAILTGNFKNDCIDFFHASEISVSGADGIKWTLDGEMAVSDSTLTISNIHNAINFYIPPKHYNKLGGYLTDTVLK